MNDWPWVLFQRWLLSLVSMVHVEGIMWTPARTSTTWTRGAGNKFNTDSGRRQFMLSVDIFLIECKLVNNWIGNTWTLHKVSTNKQDKWFGYLNWFEVKRGSHLEGVADLYTKKWGEEGAHISLPLQCVSTACTVCLHSYPRNVCKVCIGGTVVRPTRPHL